MKSLSDHRSSTLAYYDQNASAFCASTVPLDMSALYEPFLRAIPPGGRILDAGCGSGRDSAAFLRLGYRVMSIDASTEMVKASTALTGQAAVQVAFENLDFEAEFDGIWACASLLHVPRRALGDVLGRLTRALTPSGVLYLSFKAGTGERLEAGRLFTDMTEADLSELVLNHPRLRLDQVWVSADVRKERQGERAWVNAIVRREAIREDSSSCDELLCPGRLWTRDEVLSSPSPVPAGAGVYGWYFRRPPASIPLGRCVSAGAFSLLYIGISPSAPPTNGKAPSKQTLQSRVRYHMRGNAEGSTLRLSLGCLLANDLGIELRRVGSGTRMTFGPGEAKLSEWLSDNARVLWARHPAPWELEERLIGELDLPLNLDQNSRNGFWAALSTARREAKQRAQRLPVLG